MNAFQVVLTPEAQADIKRLNPALWPAMQPMIESSG